MSSFERESSLQVLRRVEMAREATDLFISVMRFSSSPWHIETRLGLMDAIRFMTLRAANLLMGLLVLVTRQVSTENGFSTSIRLP